MFELTLKFLTIINFERILCLDIFLRKFVRQIDWKLPKKHVNLHLLLVTSGPQIVGQGFDQVLGERNDIDMLKN